MQTINELQPSNANWSKQWSVQSSSDETAFYKVSMGVDGWWACSCVGWCRHYPRKDCKHITLVKMREPADHARMPKTAEITVERGAVVAKTIIPKESQPYFVVQTMRRIKLED